LCKDAYKIALQFFRSGFYGPAGGGTAPVKSAYNLPKGRLPEYNGRVFVYAGPFCPILQAQGFALRFSGPVFCGETAKNALYREKMSAVALKFL
jgi:hypothetical protein